GRANAGRAAQREPRNDRARPSRGQVTSGKTVGIRHTFCVRGRGRGASNRPFFFFYTARSAQNGFPRSSRQGWYYSLQEPLHQSKKRSLATAVDSVATPADNLRATRLEIPQSDSQNNFKLAKARWKVVYIRSQF